MWGPYPEPDDEPVGPWETEGDLPFLDDGWPEHMAGPEYWLYKKENEEDGS